MKCLTLLLMLMCMSGLTQAEFSHRHYLLYDADYFDEFYVKANDEDALTDSSWHTELRAFKSTLTWEEEQFKSKLQYKWQQGSSEWGDAWLAWDRGDDQLTLGRAKVATSHEANMSYRHLAVIERSMVTKAFVADRSVGVFWQQKKNCDVCVSISAFELEGAGIEELNQGAAPKGLQLGMDYGFDYGAWGASFEWRDLDQALFQIKVSPSVHLGDKVIRSGRFYGDQQRILQTQINRLNDWGWWSSELWVAQVEADEGDTYVYSGAYLQWVYNTHGAYQLKRQQVRVKRRYLAHSWDWILKADFLSLEDHETGARANTVLAGVNYHFSKGLSLMNNLMYSLAAGQLVSEASKDAQADGLAISARLRYQF